MTLIKHKFTTLNKYVNAERTNKFMAAKIKREETEIARLHFIGKKFKTPCKIKFTWLVCDKRSDLDNIAYAKKYILDGMYKSGAIPNDGMKHIQGFTDEFKINDYWGVEIDIEEIN
jgi:Holliday junction resolvase RusA-like endonuclease